jgi:hypothetical protein
MSTGSRGRIVRSLEVIGVPPTYAFEVAFEALERHRPDYVEANHWRQAVEDGRRFLGKWDEQAAALGWTADDLFGLRTPPAQPHPSYDRLARYDQMGLIWLLCGRSVVALTETSAAIENPSTGTVTIFRRQSDRAGSNPERTRHG